MEKLNKTREMVVNSLKESLKDDSFFNYIKQWKGNYNPTTKTEYKGINKLLLSFLMSKNKWNDNRFMTFNQIKKEPNLHLKEGAKGVPIEYWYLFDKEEKKSLSFFDAKKLGIPNNQIGWGDDKRYSVCSKCYYVFNAEFIEGIEERIPKIRNNQELKAEQVLLNYCDNENIKINHYTDKASYIPNKDIINIPVKENFNDNKSYLQVLAHEIVHSTGAKDRLNRDFDGKFGDKKYALEELKAEIGSSILCTELGIQQDGEESNKAYLKSWLSCLEDKPTEFLKALNDTLKAVDFIEEKGNMEKVYERNNSTESKKMLNKDEVKKDVER